jgi:hypothetical protein
MIAMAYHVSDRFRFYKIKTVLFLSALIWAVVGSSIAKADSIDGTWCHDREPRTMSINGQQWTLDRLVGTGQYGRHSFVFDWPVQDQTNTDAGSRIQLRLMGEMNLSWVITKPNGESSAAEYWHRCQPTT